MQQWMTKNPLFAFGTDPTLTQRQPIQVEYQLSRKWSVSVVRNEEWKWRRRRRNA